MIRYHFDLYPRSDPKNGARVVRFTKLQSAEYRGEANGTGAGRFSIRADTAEAQNIDPAGLQYVRVVREDTVAATELVVGGFFLDSGDFTALDERGTRLLTFGGAGTLSYLARAIMASHTYISPIFTGQDPFDDTWRLYAQSTVYANGNYLGAMLWRVIYEAQHFTPGSHRHADGVTYSDTHADDRPANALPALTMGFDAFNDSNAAAWAVSSGEFKAQVGENVLGVVKRLMEAGLYVSMDPDTFELNAYPASTHRRDRTGAAWGASVIRFQAPTDGTTDTGNIKSDANRAIAAFIKRSWLLAGSGDVYGDAVGTTDIPWEGFYASDTAEVAALNNIAGVQVGARDDAGDTLRLRGRLGNSPTTGLYLPFEHVLLDDLGTIYTGIGQWDYNEQDFPVAAITLQLRTGGDWDVWYDMGSSFSATERRFQVASVPSHNHLPNPGLCPAFVPGSDATLFVDWDWNEDNGSGGYQQSVDAYPSISQAAGTMNAGITIPGQEGPYYRSGVSGNALPIFTVGGNKFLPCTEAVPISFSALIGNRGAPSGTATLQVRWYSDLAATLISTDSLHAAVIPGPIPNTTIQATLTPPATAIAWDIFIIGTITNVTASTGGGTDAQNPLHGTSNMASRCDHTHIEVADRGPSADDDADAGYPIGTFWLNTGTDVLYISTDDSDGAAVWVQTSVGADHVADPDAHLPANYTATTAPSINDDEDDGWAVGSVWVDVTNDNVYFATDVSVGAANWEQANGGGGSGIAETLLDAKGDLIVASAADTAARLAVGANGTVLTADSAEATGVKWGTALTNPMSAVGDIIIGGAAGAATRLAAGTNGHVLTLSSGSPAWAAAAGGGGGVSWTQDVNQSGASFAAYTAHTGTWASDGTIISQTDTAAAVRRAYIGTAYPIAYGAIAEAEVRFPTAGAGGGGTRRGGIYVYTNGTGTGGLVAYLQESSNQVLADIESVTAMGALSQTVAKDTWYKLRAVHANGLVSVYVDGTLLGSLRVVASATHVGSYFSLFTFGTKVEFRNHKCWTLSGSAPA